MGLPVIQVCKAKRDRLQGHYFLGSGKRLA